MEKFTVIILHYNQMEYIETAILSALNQTYKNIELIIADDGSKQFDKTKVNQIIKKHNKNNIEYKILVSEKNIGTVRNLNNAIKNSTGDYILCFAADDKLAEKGVLQKYYESFQKTRYNVISSNWIMCNSNLEPIKKYQKVLFLMKYNFLGIMRLYAKMCCYNIYGAGSTCYRREVFEKHGLFDERYKLIEDWPYWLHLLNNGEKIYYRNFDGLLHRDGGVSATVENKISKTKQIFYEELLQTIHYEILPNINKFNIFSRFKIIKYYHGHINNCGKYINVDDEYGILNKLLDDNKWVRKLWILEKINPRIFEKVRNLFKNNIVVPLTFVFTILVMVFIMNFFVIENKILLPIIISVVYLIIYYIVSIIKKVLITRKR